MGSNSTYDIEEILASGYDSNYDILNILKDDIQSSYDIKVLLDVMADSSYRIKIIPLFININDFVSDTVAEVMDGNFTTFGSSGIGSNIFPTT